MVRKVISVLVLSLVITLFLYPSEDVAFNREIELIKTLKNNVPVYLTKLQKLQNKIKNGTVTYDELLDGMGLATSLYLAVDDHDQKLKVVSIGYKLARKAMNLRPDRGEAYYYGGIFIGFIGFLKGAQYILNYLPLVEKWGKKAVKLSPDFHDGSPYVLLCAVFFQSPGFPISIGNIDKAKKFCSMAKEKYSKNCTSYLYLATIEDIYGNVLKAKDILSEGVRNCGISSDTVESKIWYYRDINLAKKMLDYLDHNKKIRDLLKNR